MPYLRTGLYLFTKPIDGPFFARAPPTFYLIFWPEDTTWDDDATEITARNRIAFMRYLTQLTTEVRLLISPEHESSIIWNEYQDQDDGDGQSGPESDDGRERLVELKVAKRAEEVHVEEGFTVGTIVWFYHDCHLDLIQLCYLGQAPKYTDLAAIPVVVQGGAISAHQTAIWRCMWAPSRA